MSERVTPLRKGEDNPSPFQRIIDLQKALESESALVEAAVMNQADGLRDQLDRARDLPLKPGVREEFRRMSENLTASLQRIDAIRSR